MGGSEQLDADAAGAFQHFLDFNGQIELAVACDAFSFTFVGRSAGFCRWCPICVCPAFSAPGFRSGVLLQMGGYVFHGMAHREQITNIAKICIIGNLRNSLLIYSNLSRNFLLGPSKAAEAEDGGGLAVGIVEYPLDLDRRELGTNGQGLSVSVDGLTALGGSGVDGRVPG